MVVLYISQLHIPIQSHFRFSAAGEEPSNHIMVKDQLMAERACSRFFFFFLCTVKSYIYLTRTHVQETTCASARVHGRGGGRAPDAPTLLRLRCRSRKTISRLQKKNTHDHGRSAIRTRPAAFLMQYLFFKVCLQMMRVFFFLFHSGA